MTNDLENTGTLKDYANIIRSINLANGWEIVEVHHWNDSYKIPAVLALIHSEVSEALEAFRTDDFNNFMEELADIIIRVLDCAYGLNDELEGVLISKIIKNSNRSYRHGDKRL